MVQEEVGFPGFSEKQNGNSLSEIHSNVLVGKRGGGRRSGSGGIVRNVGVFFEYIIVYINT